MTVRLGIDIGGSRVKAVVAEFDAANQMKVTWRQTSSAYERPDAPTVGRAMIELFEAARIATQPPASGLRVSLCVPGQLNPTTGVLRYAANLPDLIGVALRPLVASAAQASPGIVIADTEQFPVMPDTIAAALGSLALRPAKGRLLCISLGTGVGAAVLDDGMPLTCTNGSAGHLGQIDVSLESDPATVPIGPDGGRGSLEAYVGLPALRERFGHDETALRRGLTNLRPDDPILRALARAIRIAHAMYTPDAIRLLGGIGIALTPALPQLRQRVEDQLTGVARPAWSLDTADDPYLAAIGAASVG